MSKYTIRGSEELDERIDADLEKITKAVSPRADAGILLGGYGRGEGTPFINADGSQAPFNDYDLVVIVDTVNSAVKVHFQALEKELSAAVGLPVDLCPYQVSHLRKCEFSLLNYEMKLGHLVLWGADDVLAAMPNYDPRALPLSEGSRLLLNRGKLLLDIKRRLATAEPLDAEERVRFIKFIQKVWLAFGDAALLAAGEYHLSYAEKKKLIFNLSTPPDSDVVVAGFLGAVELKEWGDYAALEPFDVDAEFRRVVELYIRFLPWYRGQYLSLIHI